MKISKYPIANPFPSLEAKSLVPEPTVTTVLKNQRQFMDTPVPIIKNPLVKKFAGISGRFS